MKLRCPTREHQGPAVSAKLIGFSPHIHEPFLGHNNRGSSVHLTHGEVTLRKAPGPCGMTATHPDGGSLSAVTRPRPAAQTLGEGGVSTHTTFPLKAPGDPGSLFFKHPSHTFANKHGSPGGAWDPPETAGGRDFQLLTSLLLHFFPGPSSIHLHGVFWRLCGRLKKDRDGGRGDVLILGDTGGEHANRKQDVVHGLLGIPSYSSLSLRAA